MTNTAEATAIKTAVVTDLAAFRLRRKAEKKQRQAADAAKSLMLPENGNYRVYKTDALQRILAKASKVMFFSPVENIRSSTSVDKLIKCCMLFKYDLRLAGDSVLQFSIVDRIHAQIDVYFDEKIQGGNDEMLAMVADLAVENSLRGSYVSTNLLNIAMPA